LKLIDLRAGEALLGIAPVVSDKEDEDSGAEAAS
jgi:hypothetical protein